MSTEAKIRQYILENYMFTNDASALANDDSFLKKGIIDSTGILELIAFLGQKYGQPCRSRRLGPPSDRTR